MIKYKIICFECVDCKDALTVENCRKLRTGKGRRRCKQCCTKRSNNWRQENKEGARAVGRRYYHKHHEPSVKKVKHFLRTPKGRLAVLKFWTQYEEIPDTDILRNINFYTELIRDNECHYCLGYLNVTGFALDRIDNSKGHVGFNVVPCCKGCNQKKMHDTSYEEMMLLAPALREIRKRREELKWQTDNPTSAPQMLPSL